MNTIPPGYRLQSIVEYDATNVLIRQHADLVVLVRRLAVALRRQAPAHNLPAAALRYLDRIGERPQTLRGAGDSP
jgi:hypothetical protein